MSQIGGPMLLVPGATKTKTTGTVNKTVVLPISQNFLTSDNSVLLNFGGDTITVDSKNSTIVYTTKTKANRHQSNVCMHSKVRTYLAGDGTTRVRTDHASPPAGAPNYYLVNTQNASALSLHSNAVVTAKAALGGSFDSDYLRGNGQGLINLAVSELRPDLTTLSVPNFFLELDDIPRLFQLWKKNLSVAKNVAGANLNVNFGWKPFLGDLQKIVNILDTTRREIAAFEKSCNQIFHRSKVMVSEATNVSGGNQYLAETRTEWRADLTRTVEAHLVYRAVPPGQLKGLKKTLATLAESLGFELNPRIIWDALPFSFILDWFFDVGSFLNMYRIDTYKLPIVYVDSYLQYKQTLKIESNTQICYGRSDFSPWPRSQAVVGTYDYFHRMPILPDYTTLSGLGWKQPTTKQIVLLLSLATVLKK